MTETSEQTVIVHSIWYKKIPTLLTIGNSLCGFTAILWCLQAYEKSILKSNGGSLTQGSQPDPSFLPEIFASCAWLILGAMIFDALDGWTARKLKATSLHGIQMDSLADMVTFGVAPAVVVATSSHINALDNPLYIADGFLRYDRLVWMACGIYMACAACRLALYNVHAIEEKKSENFSGIPSPGAAAAVCSILIINSANLNLPEWVMTIVLPIYTATLGVLMISTIPYPHMGKWLLSPVKRNRKLILLGAIISIAIMESIRLEDGPKLTAAALVTVYVLSGPIKYFYEWITGKNIPNDDELLEEDI